MSVMLKIHKNWLNLPAMKLIDGSLLLTEINTYGLDGAATSLLEAKAWNALNCQKCSCCNLPAHSRQYNKVQRAYYFCWELYHGIDVFCSNHLCYIDFHSWVIVKQFSVCKETIDVFDDNLRNKSEGNRL